VTDEQRADGVLAGRYELIDVIGRGRSVVYRARDTRLSRDVAVKQVALLGGPSPLAVDDVRARALREARASARIASPFVVGVYDVVEERDAVWLVMELVRAPSLDQLVDEHGPLDERRAAHIGLGVLLALDAAHAEGIVHRDVKPANVLVGGSVAGDDEPHLGGPPPVKLADFGVAALRDDTSLTSPGAVIGSPSYMSPEQAAGRPVGPAADLWALGALLYFAVEGEPPFLADSPLATATAVVHAEPRPQERPGQLSRIISLLLDKEPDGRPDSHRVEVILRSVAGEPDSGDITGPAVAAPMAVAAPPTGAGKTRDEAPAPAPTRKPRVRRAVWAVAALVIVVVGAALQLTTGGGRPAVDADTVKPEAPAAAGATSTTVAAPVNRQGAADPEPVGLDRPAEPGPEVTVPAVAPAPAEPAGPTTAAPPTTTTSLPRTTTTTELEVPEVTTTSTLPETPPSTATTTVPTPEGESSAG
jgi:hypothetical protein